VTLVTTGAAHQIYVTSSEVPNTSDDDRHTESQLIRAVTRPRPITACSGPLAQRQKEGVTREEAGAHTVFAVVNSIRSSSLYSGGGGGGVKSGTPPRTRNANAKETSQSRGLDRSKITALSQKAFHYVCAL
jgi:hypothetical protein